MFPGRRQVASRSELVELYSDRASVPREVWLRLLGEAQEHVDVLVFSGTFYAQTQPRIASMLSAAAGRGAGFACVSAIRLRRLSRPGTARKESAALWRRRSGLR